VRELRQMVGKDGRPSDCCRHPSLPGPLHRPPSGQQVPGGEGEWNGYGPALLPHDDDDVPNKVSLL
jgi:hypothetical protein